MTPTCAIPLTPPPGRTSATFPALVAGHADGTCDCAACQAQIGDSITMTTSALVVTRVVIGPATASRLPGCAVNVPERRHRAHAHRKFSSLIHSLGAWAFSPGSPKPTSSTGAPRIRSKVADDGDRAAFAGDHRLACRTRRRARGARRRTAGRSSSARHGRPPCSCVDRRPSRPSARPSRRAPSSASRSRRDPDRARGGSSPSPSPSRAARSSRLRRCSRSAGRSPRRSGASTAARASCSPSRRPARRRRSRARKCSSSNGSELHLLADCVGPQSRTLS